LIKLKNWQNHRQNNEEHNAAHNQYHYRFKSINQFCGVVVNFIFSQSDTVSGQVFEITADELAQSDKYEVDDYQRVLGEISPKQ
jgi:hypothetical protein